MKKKLITSLMISLFLLSSCILLPVSGMIDEEINEIEKNVIKGLTGKNSDLVEGREYWALLIGVGIYAEHPEMEVVSILDAANMYETLIASEHWHDDHIKVITGENATKTNIIEGLHWLDSMEDEEDISVVYISSHGGPLTFFGMPLDLFPRDEADGCDEVLVTYYGFKNPYLENLRDDELNFFLNRLESSGICVIIDCCHAGGFNDLPHTSQFMKGTLSSNYYDRKSSDSTFIEDFSKDISKDGRIVLMGTREDEIGWGSVDGTFFTNALIEPLREGFGDFNGDGFVSAEEAFYYARSRIDADQHPTICDWYNGELLLTSAEKHKVDFYDDCESESTSWISEDHTDGIGGDLWHLSQVDYRSPSHCWYLGDEHINHYTNNMNNSLVSPEIHLGEKPFLNFVAYENMEKYQDNWGACNSYDFIFLDISTDNWGSYHTRELHLDSSWWRVYNISLHSGTFGDLSGETIQMRFRIVSDENMPFNPATGMGFIMIDDILICSKKAEV